MVVTCLDAKNNCKLIWLLVWWHNYSIIRHGLGNFREWELKKFFRGLCWNFKTVINKKGRRGLFPFFFLINFFYGALQEMNSKFRSFLGFFRFHFLRKGRNINGALCYSPKIWMSNRVRRKKPSVWDLCSPVKIWLFGSRNTPPIFFRSKKTFFW